MKKLRDKVWEANIYLWKNNLVYGTQGNVSGIDRNKGIVYIKPSGMPYEDLKKDMIVKVNLKGEIIEGNLKPSVDTPHHIFLYRNIKNIGGVCHTHSKFITVFSILKVPIPVLTTAHADVFGKEIPVSKYVDNQADNIGKEIVRIYEKTNSTAVILANHGLFSFGESPKKAAFYALMAEYCAEVFYYSLLAGNIINKKTKELPKEEIKKWYERYHSERYGQRRVEEK